MKMVKVLIGICVILFILVGCSPSGETVVHITDQAELARLAVESEDYYVRLAAVRKLTDQALLAKVAIEATGIMRDSVREAAVVKLTDQVVLAKVALEDEDHEVRRAAVAKLTDQATLAKVAVKDTWDYICHAAIEKITDQAALANIAVETNYWENRLAAVMRLNDQAGLSKVALEEKYPEVRHAAVLRLKNQVTLAKVAVEDEIWQVRRAAVWNLTDQVTLAKIAADEKWLDVRIAAIGKVIDQTLLQQWAEKEPQAVIRQTAVTRILNDGFLLQRLSAEPSVAVRATIIETLREKDSLRRVALTAYHREDREQALRRLQKDLQDPASDVVKANRVLKRRVKAVLNEKDNNRLLTFVMEGEYDVLRTAAAQQLKDPASLEQAALRVTDRDVLKILLSKIKDNVILKRIAADASDSSIRLAAAQKSGATSWAQIFYTATTRGATIQMLGDALAAVSLFPEVQHDTVSAVQQACLNLIQRGDESRIHEMVDLLEGYGDRTLAEDYLNCGQPDLSAKARVWAQQRGYSVGTGAGSQRAAWGGR